MSDTTTIQQGTFKAKVALDALTRGQDDSGDCCAWHKIHPNQVMRLEAASGGGA